MSHAISSRQQNINSTHARRRSLLGNSILWLIQVLLALTFLDAGIMKLVTPIKDLQALMPLPLPTLFVYFIGSAEIAGAIGLILPMLLRIRPGLTPLAAYGLLIIMIGATVYTILSGSLVGALMPLMVGLLCLSVAYGRRTRLIADPLFARFSATSHQAS